MSQILRKLTGRQFVEFGDLFDATLLAKGLPIVIVHFLALLELARENLIEVTQAAPFAPIYMRLAYMPS
jgi:segregation and condensation protein A